MVSSTVSAARRRAQRTAALLRDEEGARARAMGRTFVVIIATTFLFLPVLGGPLWLKLCFAGTLVHFGITAAWVAWRAGRPGVYTFRVYRIFGWSSIPATIAIQYYVGVFSPAPLAITLGIAFFALGDDQRTAIALGAAVVVSYLLLAGGIVAGIIPDLGLINATRAPVWAKIFAAVMVPFIYGATLWQARLSRRATVDAVDRLHEALLLADQRKAQLHEVYEELEAALRAGAGQEGLHSGRRIGGFELQELVGRGAMGEVYAAVAPDAGPDADRVAVKVLHLHVLTDPEFRQRFLREGALTAELDSPHVLRVEEVGETDDGFPYLVMELLSGQDLASILRQAGPLSLSEGVELVQQVARGLAAAHARGIVHRDLKPHNLFRVRTAAGVTWKILDFGVAKVQGAHTLAATEMVIGTPGYMSPEQATARPTDTRSDIFSLSAIAYRVLIGRPPFTGGDVPTTMYQVVHVNPVAPLELRKDLPRDIELVLALGLAKDPEDRFGSALAFSEALQAALGNELSPEVRSRALSCLEAQPWRTARDSAPASIGASIDPLRGAQS